MKKLLTPLLLVGLSLSLSACGGSEPAETTAAATTVAETTVAETTAEEVVEEEVVEEEVVEEEVVEEVAEEEMDIDLSAYDELASYIATSYVGYNEDNEEEFAGIGFDEEGTFGVLVISNSVESVSFVGEVTAIDEETLSITDDSTGVSFVFGVVDNGDGTFTLDAGDAASLIVTEVAVEDLITVIAVVDTYTEAIDVSGEEVVEEEVAVDTSAYDDLASILSTAYLGMSESEIAAIGFNEDGTFGVLIVSTETESVSFVGEVVAEGDYLSISDEQSGLVITFAVSDNGDGTYTLDAGDAGSFVVADVTIDELIEVIAIVEAETEVIS